MHDKDEEVAIPFIGVAIIYCLAVIVVGITALVQLYY